MSARVSFRKDRWPQDLDPGDAEWALLEILWDQGPLTRTQASLALGKTGRWSSGAAPALLTRLLEQGLVRYEDRRRRPLFLQAAVTRSELRQELCRRFAQRHFAGDLESLGACVDQCRRSGSSSSEISQSSKVQG